MTNPTDPSSTDFIRMFYGITARLIEDPTRAENLIPALRHYCDNTVKPDETLIVIAVIAITRYAELMANALGPSEALSAIAELTLGADINDALADFEWDDA